MGIKVLPRPALRLAAGRAAPRSPARRTSAIGVQPLRRRGLGGDLRELREHAPGDPFKQIAWKATARTGKLMVRELDRETMVTHWLLVDIGATMREGRPGAARLDLAVDVAAAYARGALEAGDRVALLTFDGRIVGEAKPNDGPVHRLRIVERLMEAMNVVDEDLTELTDSELVAVVARYLLVARGHRRAPAPRAAPSTIRCGTSWPRRPSGELYDLRVVHQAVAAALERHTQGARDAPRRRRAAAPAPILPAARHRAALPPHRPRPAGARAASAPRSSTRRRRAAASASSCSPICRASRAISTPVARAVRLVRRRGHHLTFAVPEARIAADDDAPPRPRHRRRHLPAGRSAVASAPPSPSCARASACASSPSRADIAALLLGRTVATPRARVAWHEPTRRVIIAPFEPFAGKRRNRARDAAHLLAGEELGGAPVEIVDLPVVYAASPTPCAACFARDPSLVVLVGEVDEARTLLVERLAVNVAHARIHDNAGARPIDDELVPGGEPARKVPFDPRTAANAAIAAGCPADVSSHAGTFLLQRRALPRARPGRGSARHRRASPSSTCPARFPWARDRRAARGIYAIAKHLVPALT